MEKKSSLGLVFGKTLANHALNIPLRKWGLGRKAYEYASASGIRAELTGQSHFPRLRRAIGQIAPDITGLSDYEMSKGLTHEASHLIQKHTKGTVSHNDIVHMLGGKTSLPEERKILLDELKKHHIPEDSLLHKAKDFVVSGKSVLAKNLRGGVEKIKNEGVDTEGKGGFLRRLARKHFKGKDNQVGSYIPSVAELATGNVPTVTAAEGALTGLANTGHLNPILVAKGGIVKSGIDDVLKEHGGQLRHITDSTKLNKRQSLLKRMSTRAAEVISPATTEFRDLGRDIGRQEILNRRMVHRDRRIARRAERMHTQAPLQTPSLNLPERVQGHIDHANQQMMTHIKEHINNAKNKVQSAYQGAKNKVQSAYQGAKTRVKSTHQGAKNRVQSTYQGAKNRFLRKNIDDPKDNKFVNMENKFMNRNVA